MPSAILIGVVIALWVLVGPLVALVKAANASRRARELAERIAMLEAQLAGTGEAPSPRSTTQPAPEAPPEAHEPADEPEPAAPSPETEEPAPEPPPWEAEPEPTPDTTAAGRTRESLETTIGARWSVLVGGLALALGAVFLVRYTIEQGLLGPGARIVLGLLLSAFLFGAGEWLRRRDRALHLPIFAKADVPAILTAAGGVAAFASIYAAHALYGFIGAGTAFLLLTATGLVTLFLSVIHGPALAALGAVGSYATPLLITTTAPNPIALALHTLAVTAAVFGMARIRDWRWLAVASRRASLGARSSSPSAAPTQRSRSSSSSSAWRRYMSAHSPPAQLRRGSRTPDPIPMGSRGSRASPRFRRSTSSSIPSTRRSRPASFLPARSAPPRAAGRRSQQRLSWPARSPSSRRCCCRPPTRSSWGCSASASWNGTSSTRRSCRASR